MPISVTPVGNKFFFTAQIDGERLLFQSDGTESNTKAISDSALLISETSLTEVIDVLYFTGSTVKHGFELWKVGPDTDVPLLVRDINPRNADSNPIFLTAIDNTLYFTAGNQVINQTPIYSSNGTDENTNTVVSFLSEHNRAIITAMTATDGLLYFRLNSSTYGNELWVSDGTQKGTHIVKDLCVGCSSAPRTKYQDLFVYKNKVYFISRTQSYGHTLWRTDGTESGTRMLYDDKGNSFNSKTYVLDVVDTNVVFVTGQRGNMSLWKTSNSMSNASNIHSLIVSNESGGEDSMQG